MDTSSLFEQQTQQGSGFESLIPILLSIMGDLGKRKRSGTGSLVDTYLDLSMGGSPTATVPAAKAAPATATPAAPATPTAAAPAPVQTQPPILTPKTFKSFGLDDLVKGCTLDPKTGRKT